MVDPGRTLQDQSEFEVPLSKAAQVVLREAGRIKLGTAGYVFTTNGDTPISGFSKWKAHVDGLMLAERAQKSQRRDGDDATSVGASLDDPRLAPHARSLMSQAGVPLTCGTPLGRHRGVRGVYDRHAYREEKRQHSQRWPHGLSTSYDDQMVSRRQIRRARRMSGTRPPATGRGLA